MLKQQYELVATLLLSNLLHLRLLRAQETENVIVRITPHNKTRRNSRLAICDDALTTHFLHLSFVGSKDIILRLGALRQWEEDDALSIRVELASWLLDVGELGVQGRERGVTERIGFLDVGRNIFVGLGKVRRELRGEGIVGGAGEVEGFGAVWVGFEG